MREPVLLAFFAAEWSRAPLESPQAYLERGANLHFYAEIAGLAEAMRLAGAGPAGARPAAALEIGCSYGFLIDLAARLFGWRVTGVDPGATARQGAAELGIDIVDATVEAADLGALFDLVLAVQVVEHLPDPAAFASRIAGLVGDTGIVLLTTPDASVEDLGAEYHPGEHHVLFSREGITRLLRAAGFAHLRFFAVSLPQMLCVAASRSPLPAEPLPRVCADDAQRGLETYLSRRLGDALPPGPRLGLAFRLFELLVNAGRYAETEALLPALDADLGLRAGERIDAFVERVSGAMLSARTTEGYLLAGPACFAPYLFYRGILFLNHRGDLPGAKRCFARSALLFEREVETHGLSQYRPWATVAAEHARMVAARNKGITAALLDFFRGRGR